MSRLEPTQRPPIGTGGPEWAFHVDDLAVAGTVASASTTLAASWLDGDPASEGTLGVLADDVLGYAAVCFAPPSHWSVSTDIAFDLLVPVGPATGTVSARAEALHVDATGSVAVCELADGDGRPVAHVVQRGRWVPFHDFVETPETPAEGAVSALLDVEADGPAAIRLPATGLALNRLGMLHGGVALYASMLAARRALGSAGLGHLAPRSIRITYPRPVAPGSEPVFQAELRHGGRSFALLDVVGSVDGRACTIAQVTAHPA